MILWFYNRKTIVFIPFPGTECLGISCDEKQQGAFCYVMELTFGKYLRMATGCHGRQPSDKRVGTFSPTPWPPGRGEGLEVEFSHHQRFNKSCLHNAASIQTQKERVWRAFGLVNSRRCEESGAPGEAWKLCTLSPYFAVSISSIWLFLSYILL